MQPLISVVGRFQPFHWGHYDYVMAATRLSQSLVVGITNPDASGIYVHESNTRRSQPEANPFTFDERCRMIHRTLEFLAPHIDVSFRRCVLGMPEATIDSLGSVDIVAVTIYDKWGGHRAELFRKAGYTVEVLWERVEKITTGSEIRARLRDGRPWRHLVPPGCAEVIDNVLSERGINRIWY